MKTALAASVIALIPCLQAPCQSAADTAARSATADGKTDEFVLDAGTITLRDLIQKVSAHLDYNILFQEVELQSITKPEIELTRRTQVDRQGCWELFGSLLFHKGFAVVALDEPRGLYEVILINGPRGREVIGGAMFVPDSKVEDYANQRATPILTTVSLQHINATIATNALRPFFASTGQASGSITLGNVGNNSDMLLLGFAPQVAAAHRLLKLIDRGDASAAPEIRVVRLEHGSAEELVARLDEVFGARAMQIQAQQAAGMSTGLALRTVAHPALNALILSGSSTQIRDAVDLIATLDAPPVASSQPSTEVLRRIARLEARVQQLEQALRRDGEQVESVRRR